MSSKQLKLGVIISYCTTILSTIISFVYTPIMLGILGQSEYGLYQLSASMIAYITLLNLGLSVAYIRNFSLYKVKNDYDGIARLNGMNMIIFSVLGAITAILGSMLVIFVPDIFADTLSKSEIVRCQIIMSIMTINAAMVVPLNIFSFYTRANERYMFFKIVQLGKVLINPAFVLILLFSGYGSVSLAIASVLTNFAMEIAYIVYCFKKLEMKFDFKNFDCKMFKEMIIFSSFIFINMIVNQLNDNVDKFLLGILQGTTAVAVYSIAFQFKGYFNIFSNTITSVFVPRVNSIVAENSFDMDKKLNALFCRLGRLQFVLLFLILSGFYFFGKDFIYFWVGKEFKMSYYVALAIMAAVTIPFCQNLGIIIQQAKNKHKFRSIVYLVIAIANVILSIPLAKIYGVLGCVFGTVIATLIGEVFFMNIYYHKVINLNMIKFWKEILKLVPSFMVPVSLGIFIANKVDLTNFLNFVNSIIVYTIVYCICMFAIGFNDSERNLLIGPIKRRLRK